MSSPAALCIVFISLALFPISPAITQKNTSTVYEVLQGYDFPVGILPKDVTSYSLNRSTGKFTVHLNKTCTFSVNGHELKYDTKVAGVISNNTIKDLSGAQVKVLFFWLDIVEVTRKDDKLDFSVGIASADFPVKNFLKIPECGCGFDCANLVGIENLPLLGWFS